MKQFKFYAEDSVGIVVLDEYNDDIMFVKRADVLYDSPLFRFIRHVRKNGLYKYTDCGMAHVKPYGTDSDDVVNLIPLNYSIQEVKIVPEWAKRTEEEAQSDLLVRIEELSAKIKSENENKKRRFWQRWF